MAQYTGDPKLHPPSSFPASISGTCLCGSIAVTLTDPDLFTRRRGHLCHCANCRILSGSLFSTNLALREEQVLVEDREGILREYRDERTGGAEVVRWFCGRCGAQIKAKSAKNEEVVVVKTGLFPRIPEPEFEFFVEHCHEWEPLIPGTVRYKLMPGGEKM